MLLLSFKSNRFKIVYVHFAFAIKNSCSFLNDQLLHSPYRKELHSFCHFLKQHHRLEHFLWRQYHSL
uniref:Candidate secreted effector n=1 Tax=Meloidogyne incognita TaxID=6306 RepID=A0A914KTK8_MELIC